MSDPRDYKLDLSSARPVDRAPAARQPVARPFLSILFACCHVYTRVYRSRDATHYDAVCPRCGKRARFIVGPHGATSRAFVIE